MIDVYWRAGVGVVHERRHVRVSFHGMESAAIDELGATFLDQLG